MTQLAAAYAGKSVDEIKAALAGATVKVYSCPQPETADHPVIRNGFLAEFTFASPAFNGEEPIFVDPAVPAKNVGTPLFSRATLADGTVVGDFSTGPGNSDIKLAEVSCSKDAPVKVTKFQIRPDVANGVMPVNPTDLMRDRIGTNQISHEQSYHWNHDFESRKTK
jgi:hypothetical protein